MRDWFNLILETQFNDCDYYRGGCYDGKKRALFNTIEDNIDEFNEWAEDFLSKYRRNGKLYDFFKSNNLFFFKYLIMRYIKNKSIHEEYERFVENLPENEKREEWSKMTDMGDSIKEPLEEIHKWFDFTENTFISYNYAFDRAFYKKYGFSVMDDDFLKLRDKKQGAGFFENSGDYSVYIHIMPNNTIYIGLTKQSLNDRWQNGEGYKKNGLFYKLIKKYGWENIDHLLVKNGLTKMEAEDLEKTLIRFYSNNEKVTGRIVLNIRDNEK